MEHNFAVNAKAQELEHMCNIEKPPAVSPAGWNLEKIGIVRKRNKTCDVVELLNTHLMELREQASGHANGPSELRDAQDASPRFKARYKSAHEHTKVIEHHLRQVAGQLTVAQARLVQEKSSSEAIDVALLIARDLVEDQCSLATNGCRLEPLLQKATVYFSWASYITDVAKCWCSVRLLPSVAPSSRLLCTRITKIFANLSTKD